MDTVSLNKVQKNNIYDRFIILLLCFLIFGGIGGALRPVRILIILFLPFTVKFFIRNKSAFLKIRSEFIFFMSWVVYGLISVTWAVNTSAALKEVIYLIINFSGFFVLIHFYFRANNPNQSIILGWVWLFVLSLPIAIFELNTNVHFLSSNSEELHVIGGDVRRYASVTYGNLNAYNLVLTYILPFVFSLLFILKNKKQKLISVVLVSMLSAMIMVNSSRGAVFCLGIGFLLFVIFSLRNSINKTYVVYLMLLVSICFVYFFDVIFKVILSRFDSNAQGFGDEYREIVFKKGLIALEEYSYLGVGAGNFQESVKGFLRNYDFFSSHNFFLEVLIQYGVFIFLFFLLFLFKIMKFKNEKIHVKFILVYFILTILINSIINSNYLAGVEVWCYLASVYALSRLDSKRTYI